jgi:hypothetical protein
MIIGDARLARRARGVGQRRGAGFYRVGPAARGDGTAGLGIAGAVGR